jgi:thioredoxin-like negative regulator of GroEL
MALARREGHPPRLVERAQYHLIQTLQREPSTERTPEVIRDLGIVCMLTGRHREAERFFGRLKQHDRYRASAHRHLGEVSFQLGKYNNAIQHLRQYLRKHPDNADVLARVALCWFHLEEYSRARETCHQALMADPDHVEARYALGCALMEEGIPNEAMKVFREALKERPDHMSSYAEMVRARRLSGDLRWMQQALQAEVSNHDRLAPGGTADPRAVTRDRVHVVLDEMRVVGDEMVPAVLGAIAHTQDEGLRFLLWEAASELAVGTVAGAASVRLQRSNELYGPGLGGLALAAATAIPEPHLVSGLRLEEADLKRAAVDRHPPAHDVQAHRENLKTERNRARAHQALLLLAIGQRHTPSATELLRRWADAADPELATAAWAALVMNGDPEAAGRLRNRAAEQGQEHLVERLLEAVSPPAEPLAPRKVSGDSETSCSTCGRGHAEVTHMIAGGSVVVCDRCVVHITTHRATLSAPDDAACGLCGRTHFESAGLYRYNGVDICNSCMQLSLGLLEREEIESFLESWGTR